MNMPFTTFAGRPQHVPNAPLVCLACGLQSVAACRCGAPFVRPGARAWVAVKENPQLSNRILAERLGLDESTVRRARKGLYSANAELAREAIVSRNGQLRVAFNKLKAKPEPQPQPAKLFKPRMARNLKKPVTEKEHLIAFTRELSQFVMHFSLELTKWLDTNPAMEPEGRDALAHTLEAYSMQLQRLAQRVDGR